MLSLFFSVAPFFCTVAPFFHVALSLLYCVAPFFPWRNFFLPLALFFCTVSLAYITIPTVSKQKGKTTPTQSNDTI
jgi:hypothetical protein